MYSTISDKTRMLLGNNAAFYLSLPQEWRSDVLSPQDYVSFIKDIHNGLQERPILGAIMFGKLSNQTVAGILEISKYIDTLKQEGSAFIDCHGCYLDKEAATLMACESIKRIGFFVPENKTDVQNIRYGLDRTILNTDSEIDLTAYAVYRFGQRDKVAKGFELLRDYNIKTCILTLHDFGNAQGYKKAIKNQDQIFDDLCYIREKSKEYGIEYLACEDHQDIFRDKHQDIDMFIYTLRGGLRLDLSPEGRMTIIGGHVPHDAGIWHPDQQNAYDFVINTLKQQDDPIWRNLTAEQSPIPATRNTKFRSSVLASAVMAGRIDKQIEYMNEL